MYMPDASFARQSLDCGLLGRLLLFEVYDPELHRRDDVYTLYVRELEKEGLHRNVFLVDDNCVPCWRIADYEQPYPDSFVSIERSEKDGTVIGTTFHGHIFEISLADGALNKIGWTK